MATTTERFGFTLPAGVDPVSVVVLNLNTQNIERYLGATQDMIAPMYDEEEGTYAVDDVVQYDNGLYKCLEDIDTPEVWDETKWEQTYAILSGGGGGGGTEVIPNPQGTPTDTLNTVEIDGTIYDIEGSGGGGSGEQFVWSYTRSITTTSYGWWVVEDEDGQSLDPDEYAIIDIFVTNQPYYSAFWAKTSSENVYRMEFVDINDLNSIRSSKTATIQVLYMKRDAISGGGGGSSEGDGVEIYSENEYIVGKWIDGKKLYQKTFIWDETISGSTNKSISLDNPEYAFIIDASGINQDNAYIPIPYAHSNSNNNTGVFLASTKDSIGFRIGSSTTLKKAIITIRYTKTVETDAPAWGGSVNNYGGFIDTSNIIDSGTFTSTFTYTATEDCWIFANLVTRQNAESQAYVDGEQVASVYSATGGALQKDVMIPVKKGQVFTVNNSEAWAVNYAVYGTTYSSSSSGGASTADAVTYDNTDSGLTATNVQDAVDEVVTSVEANASDIADLQSDMSDAQDDISELNSNLSTLLQIRSVTKDDISMASGTNATANVAIPTISGYTPIGIIRVTLGGSGSGSVVIYSFEISSGNNGVFFKWKNYGSGTANPTIVFTVLYQKNL